MMAFFLVDKEGKDCMWTCENMGKSSDGIVYMYLRESMDNIRFDALPEMRV
jgi:hypothetical protein